MTKKVKELKQTAYSVYVDILFKLSVKEWDLDDTKSFPNIEEAHKQFLTVLNKTKEVSLRFFWVAEHLKYKLFDADLNLPRYMKKGDPSDQFVLNSNGMEVKTASRGSLRDTAKRYFGEFCKHIEFTNALDIAYKSEMYSTILERTIVVDRNIASETEVIQLDKQLDAGTTTHVTDTGVMAKQSETCAGEICAADVTEEKKLKLKKDLLVLLSEPKTQTAECCARVEVPYEKAKQVTRDGGTINLYVFVCFSHLYTYVEDLYKAILKVKDDDDREMLVESILQLYVKGLLVKVGYFTEILKNVSTKKQKTNHLICSNSFIISLNFALVILTH